MYNRHTLTTIILLFLIFSCQSINSTREELGIQGNFVIFSFDDGPDEYTTPKLLVLLEKYQIKAMFCLLGVNAEQYPELTRRIYDEGHLIVNHGYYDRFANFMNDDQFTDNLIRGQQAISSALGFDMYPKLYRPHGGYYNSRRERILINNGYSIVSASIRVYDAVGTSAKHQRTVNRIINTVIKEEGGIILLHDARGSYSRKIIELEKNPKGPYNRLWIIDAVEEIIVSLLEKDFILHHADLLAAIGLEN